MIWVYITVIVGVIMTSLPIYFLIKEWRKEKKKKPCYGEWGFEGENCQYCKDEDECCNISND